MSAPVVEPSACTWCTIARRGHGRQFADAVGYHEWAAPTQEQILARMKARRLALTVAREGALPVPVVPEPRTLDVVEHELTGARLSLYEEELETARLRLALASAKRGRRELRELVRQMVDGLNGHDCPPPGESPMEAVTRFAVRLMEAERLLAEDGCSCPPVDRTHQIGCPLDGVPASSPCERPMDGLTKVFVPVASLREPEPEFHGLLHHDYRVGHDLPETGGAQ